MSKIGSTIRSYIWWSHERGSFHYDVMVTLILLFLFVTPYFVDFHDRPAERAPRNAWVTVRPDADGSGFVYLIDANSVTGTDDASTRASLMHVIEPIAGEVVISKYEKAYDTKGALNSYRVWVRRR